MPNITSFNINDVALYYHAMSCLAGEPSDITTAAERVRERLVTYLERRRAVLSLPPLRTEMPSLGEKAISELKQMKLVQVEDGNVHLLAAGAEVLEKLSGGEGRPARRLILGRMLDTFDNVYEFVKRLSPPVGRDLILPMPQGSTVGVDAPDDGDVEPASDAGLDLERVCAAWTAWCEEHQRLDLLPPNFLREAETLSASSKDPGTSNRIKNVVQQLVLDRATDGAVVKMPIFRTLRDRLMTAGAINSRTLRVESAPIALELVYSCVRFAAPESDVGDWARIDVPRTAQSVYVHEPEPEQLAVRLHAELRAAARSLVPRAGYYRIYELRDRVCDALRISVGVFDAAFVHGYREKQGALSLGVDYETITAKRLPIEVRDQGRSEHFNLVAFRDPIEGVDHADHHS